MTFIKLRLGLLLSSLIFVTTISGQQKNRVDITGISKSASVLDEIKSEHVSRVDFKTAGDGSYYPNHDFRKEKDYYIISFPNESQSSLMEKFIIAVTKIYTSPDAFKKVGNMIIINANTGERVFKEKYIINFKYKLQFQFKDAKIRVDSPTSWGYLVYYFNVLGQKELCEENTSITRYAAVEPDVARIINEDINKILDTMRKNDNW